MADRKAELERKRAKLNALREEKERKKKEKELLKGKVCLIHSKFYVLGPKPLTIKGFKKKLADRD